MNGDTVPPTENLSPKTHRLTKVLVISAGATLFLASVVFILNSLNILSLSQLFQKQTTQTTTNDNKVVNTAAKDLTELVFPCPVQIESCNTGTKITFNNHPSFAYRAAPESTVSNLVRTTKEGYVSFLSSQDENERHLYQSFILENNCYVLTYIFPPDFSNGNVFALPLDNGDPLGLLGSEFIVTSDGDKSVVLQLQKFSSSDCSLKDRAVEDLGNDYLELDEKMFR